MAEVPEVVRLGEVTIDSGTLLLSDLSWWRSHLEKYDPKGFMELLVPVQEASEALVEAASFGAGTMPGGEVKGTGEDTAVFSSTGYGDGTYPVFATLMYDPITNSRRVKELRIIFVPDESIPKSQP